MRSVLILPAAVVLHALVVVTVIATAPSEGVIEVEVGSRHVTSRSGESHSQRLMREEHIQDATTMDGLKRGIATAIQKHGAVQDPLQQSSALSQGATAPSDITAPSATEDEKDPAQWAVAPGPPADEPTVAPVVEPPIDNDVVAAPTPAPLNIRHAERGTTLHPHAVILPGDAQTNCPWLGGANTGDDTYTCFDGESCNPTADGENCCIPKGGKMLCNVGMMLCETRNCEGDHCCKANCDAAEDGGERWCVTGPLGDPGPTGAPGAAGLHGAAGNKGAVGDSGDVGPPGERGEEGSEGLAGETTAPKSAANFTILVVTIILNTSLAVAMYFLLKFLYTTHKNKAASPLSF